MVGDWEPRPPRHRSPIISVMLKLRSLVLLPLVALAACGHSQIKFSVQYPASAFAGPFSGRVVVYLNHGSGEPRIGPDWLQPQPMYSAFFKDVAPGMPMVISDANAVGFPGKIGPFRAAIITSKRSLTETWAVAPSAKRQATCTPRTRPFTSGEPRLSP